MKDFLIVSNRKSKSANNVFKRIARDYKADLVYVSDLRGFDPCNKKYKNVIVCTGGYNEYCSSLIEDNFANSCIIQHDTTDEEHVQVFLKNRVPDLIFQRELTEETVNIFDCPIEPLHFAIDSIYQEELQKKDIDVSVMMTMTNPRRRPFVEHAVNLAKNDLSHLRWHIRVTPQSVHTPREYVEVCNRSKIGLHYFGNSYDSSRIWELASTKTAIIMPKLRLKSTDVGHMPFLNYEKIDDSFLDLKNKIVHLLEDNRWKKLAKDSYADFESNHTPEKCYEKYIEVLKKHQKL